ncbi:hypothetical protein AHAS_Ahas19G0157900 [Arachis hypogaea]
MQNLPPLEAPLKLIEKVLMAKDIKWKDDEFSTSFRGDNERGKIPIAETLRHQIEIQKRLEEQLDIRIEAQEKYLQVVLEKAQRTLSMEGSGSFHNYHEVIRGEENIDQKPKIKEGSIQFDLDSRCTYDLVSASGCGSEIEAKMLSYRL